jgi:hypothetical protein
MAKRLRVHTGTTRPAAKPQSCCFKDSRAVCAKAIQLSSPRNQRLCPGAAGTWQQRLWCEKAGFSPVSGMKMVPKIQQSHNKFVRSGVHMIYQFPIPGFDIIRFS